MTSLTDRPNTALLVVDMQRDVVAQAHEVDRVVANINALVDKARFADRGYLPALSNGDLDASVFERLASDGRELSASGEDAEARDV